MIQVISDDAMSQKLLKMMMKNKAKYILAFTQWPDSPYISPYDFFCSAVKRVVGGINFKSLIDMRP